MPVRKKRIDRLTLHPITLGPHVDLDSIIGQRNHMQWVVIVNGKAFYSKFIMIGTYYFNRLITTNREGRVKKVFERQK